MLLGRAQLFLTDPRSKKEFEIKGIKTKCIFNFNSLNAWNLLSAGLLQN